MLYIFYFLGGITRTKQLIKDNLAAKRAAETSPDRLDTAGTRVLHHLPSAEERSFGK